MSKEKIKLIAFDVDGTLVIHHGDQVVWQLFHEKFCGDASFGWKHFKQYLAKEITYQQWVDFDVGSWKTHGATKDEMETIIDSELQVVAQGIDTLHALRKRGYTLAIISGTLNIVLNHLLDGIPFSYVFSNKIFFNTQGLIENWEATPFDVDGKARALAYIAQQEHITLQECAFVGDHLNDIPVLETAGFSIAFCPKDDRVSEVADISITKPDLSLVLPHFLQAAP